MFQKLTYGAGFWIGDSLVVPFIDGFLDAVEPKLQKRIRESVSNAIPGWLKELLT